VGSRSADEIKCPRVLPLKLCDCKYSVDTHSSHHVLSIVLLRFIEHMRTGVVNPFVNLKDGLLVNNVLISGFFPTDSCEKKKKSAPAQPSLGKRISEPPRNSHNVVR
jgi:hypothetical protein